MRYLLIPLLFTLNAAFGQIHILLEAESFDETGNWKIDQQFFETMGSPYLLAHGMGESVGAASTKVKFPKKGDYYLWVRTKDWAPFPKGPGVFEVLINGKSAGEFGSSGLSGWQWYEGGKVSIKKEDSTVEIFDKTGFEGRCDAIWLTDSPTFEPPNDIAQLANWRNTLLQIPEQSKIEEGYDLVIIGGGMAGTSAAIVAARNGLKTALIQNRPVLGGNNSSEIRVHLMGNTDKNHYPKLGSVVTELDYGDPGNGNPNGDLYGDEHKLNIARAEQNLSLFLNMHAYAVTRNIYGIESVTARNIKTNEDIIFKGKLFSDCTGDGSIGFLAGADYRWGRENRELTGEPLAPVESDSFTLGTSNLWASLETEEKTDFPEVPWALQFSDEYHIDEFKSDWQWETGFGNFNTIYQAEEIRDHNFRAIYGNWSYLKNNKPEKYGNRKLAWMAYVGGKRESRRLLGDYILNQMDVQGENGIQPDGFVTATWTIDLHFPNAKNSKYFEGEEFFASTKHVRVQPYTIPYRCLYSRNIPNLFMAGRDISTTHIAFGSTRVMRTCGMMGEVVGYAASVAVKNGTTPRGVYQNHLEELRDLIEIKVEEQH